MYLGSAVVVSAAVGHWGCEVPPLMAPGSSVSLIANPEFIVANGGVSVITAIVTEPAGTFAPDGSVVLFFTNLGRIEAEGKTVNGVARVNLIADSRSGPATVIGFAAGGDAPVPAPTGSPTSTPGGGGGQSSDTVTVSIGSARPDRIVLTASPPTVRAGGSSTITVNVFDEFGNPVANVPVNFSITQSSAPNARLESGGSQRFTDSNGQAFDTLRTGAVLAAGTVTVTATVAGDLAETATITVTL
jgi:hypothetical protein